MTDPTYRESNGGVFSFGSWLRRAEVSEDRHYLTQSGGRDSDDFYRQRWAYDKVVRSTHGVNCTGSCSWKVYVKDGVITWESQQTDYPTTGPDMPDYEPRGCPRGAAFSWYTYSPTRIRYPYVRSTLLDFYREAKQRVGDPVLAWKEVVEDPQKSGSRQLGRSERNCRRRPRVHGETLRSGPHRRVLRDPRHVDGFLRSWFAILRTDRLHHVVLLRLVRGPAARFPASVRRPN